ncbi:membrane protein [Afipia sp. P52-10]|uniref:efflux transporter outer membrane subunit n=1 Tax=Afipia sp. P52-10 TaxID=1429916 RepID=UPI0003DF2A4E|nr:efflux transporter outer membrane subunit [Afipia sp. P52-10]ETR76673.1 membrane protein [Afipia sp. P52-10]
MPRSRWRLIGCALSPVMLLTACTVGPDFKSPEPPASQGYRPGEKLASSTDVPGRWWERFRSRPLNELIYDGLANNTDLHAAEAALRVAQANALAQRGALFPEITAGFNSNRQLTPTEAVTTNAASGASLYSVHTAQVSVSFVPDVFGGTRRQIESSDAQVEMQAFQREGVFLTLSANIALAAIQEASLRGQIAATQRLIDLQVQSLNLLKIQNERGQIAMPDVVAQETAVAQARLLLPGLEKQLNQQRHLLAYLTGRLPSDPLPATFQLSSFRLPRPLPRTLPADLIRQRPDVRAAESNLHAVNAQIGVAIAARLPQIALTANAGSSASTIASLFSPHTAFWMAAGSVAQTVFDAGIREQKQRAAEAATDQALAQYRSAVLAACQNVADVLRALEADERTLNAAIAAERSAEQSITLARAQIERGQVAISVLITAQQAFLQASLARVQAQAGRLADTVALFQALGGGWWNRIEVDPRVEAFNAALEKTQARAQAAQADAATAQ